MKVDEGGNPDFVTELNPTDVNLLVESALPYRVPAYQGMQLRTRYMGVLIRTQLTRAIKANRRLSHSIHSLFHPSTWRLSPVIRIHHFRAQQGAPAQQRPDDGDAMDLLLPVRHPRRTC